MSETKIRDTAVAYQFRRPLVDLTELPPEFAWFRWLTPDEQSAFLHALLEILARVWAGSDMAPLKREVERWQRQAQERKAVQGQAERQTLWSAEDAQQDQQRALIDEMLQSATSSMDTTPSVAQIRALLRECIPYADKLSDQVMAMRYEET